jgi:hypothetical protein
MVDVSCLWSMTTREEEGGGGVDEQRKRGKIKGTLTPLNLTARFHDEMG